MTTVIKSHTDKEYHITIAIEFGRYGSFYQVEVCPRFGECECSYPVRSMAYPITEEKKARATFNRYKRIYKSEV